MGVISALGVFLVLFLFFLFLWWREYDMYQPLTTKAFDSAQWKLAGIEKDEGGFHPLEKRCGMYHDLATNHLHKGMTIEEVKNLLGEEDLWWYCTDRKRKCMYYYMGMCYWGFLSGIPMAVHACFNRQGRLVTYHQTENYCEMQGSYDVKTKEQYCFKETPYGTAVPTNECGIDPW